MTNDPNDGFQDDLGIEIEVYVKDGECFQVNYRGRVVHARVYDFDVEFPCTAASLGQDEHGDYFTETIL